MTPHMEMVLEYLKGWPDTRFKQSEIAHQVGLKLNAIGAILSNLAHQGFIKREEKEKTKDIFFHYPKPVEKGSIAEGRTFDWKPMGLYNMKSHMEACEESRSLKNGGLI